MGILERIKNRFSPAARRDFVLGPAVVEPSDAYWGHDVIIRLMDAAEQYGWDIAGAIVAKAEYNKGRDYRHGKDF